jgi:hypothetical protein
MRCLLGLVGGYLSRAPEPAADGLGSGIRTRIVIVSALVTALLPGPSPAAPAASLDPFRGMGAWVDVFDRNLYANPEGTVQTLASEGVQTLFLQTATYRLRGPLMHPDLAARFIEAAHAAGMYVVAWYVPDFADLRRDLDWSLAAVGFTTPTGERFDAFGLDIEVTEVADPNERAARLVELSRQIRAAVGPAYPLGAITPAPLRDPGYWPVFPDAELAGIYDVYVPMAYWSFHVEGAAATRDYTEQSIATVRAATGRPDLPIHLIGGQTDGTEGDEVGAFVDAVEANDLLGASLYDAALSGPEDWGPLRRVRFVPPPPEPEPEREGPPRLVINRDLGAYGNLPDGKPRPEVVFESGPLRGGWEVDYQAFDLGRDEVALSVNGDRVATLEATDPGAWGPRRTVSLPEGVLRGDGPNILAFAPVAGGLATGTWGVREVTAVAPPIPLDDSGPHGNLPSSDFGREDRATYGFDGGGGTMAVTVRGFDVAGDEVRVLLNGKLAGSLADAEPGRWGPPATLLLEPRPGPNVLTFDSTAWPGRDDPWAVRVTAAGRSFFG